VLTRHVLQELAGQLKHRPLRILSAGCSSGDEPYSIRCLLAGGGGGGQRRPLGCRRLRPQPSSAAAGPAGPLPRQPLAGLRRGHAAGLLRALRRPVSAAPSLPEGRAFFRRQPGGARSAAAGCLLTTSSSAGTS
jgi:hypothetical protein